ncbi:hypothetical protein BZA05DRAFT_174639 [Tricharina praecox]|uniref:uncharacterized protein n=1 Tax=Tricharina praecox TaxID=43433 RepID=UPI002220F038|nr:uncharacterized protein BZA05DRAFT_174639 [Tricharina praecox]KAI5844343.1 hypothetical protein BZA05DRAFT_174639 [Tricharina praecox]
MHITLVRPWLFMAASLIVSSISPSGVSRCGCPSPRRGHQEKRPIGLLGRGVWFEAEERALPSLQKLRVTPLSSFPLHTSPIPPSPSRSRASLWSSARPICSTCSSINSLLPTYKRSRLGLPTFRKQMVRDGCRQAHATADCISCDIHSLFPPSKFQRNPDYS